MNDVLKSEVRKELEDYLISGMFGDGLEKEYVYYGVNFKGLLNMTDQELYELLVQYKDGEQSDLLDRVECELGIERMITETNNQ